jgi:dehydrogenase/reductase SDR family member 1
MTKRGMLEGQVALVTGGSRGVGKGIAEALSEAGATVYVTGRTVGETEFATECIPIPCDHTDHAQVESAFARIRSDHGRLDILAKSVWGGYEQMVEGGEFTWTRPFWQQPLFRWDAMFSAGVRAYFVASRFAAEQMVKRRSGLIVNISSWSAQKHAGNLPYGVSKAATDKMTRDMAHELKEHGVSVVSLYPGMVRTEKVVAAAQYLDRSNSESPQFIGRAIAALAADPNILATSGSVVVAAACAEKYGFVDIDGKCPKPLTLADV